MTVNVTLAGLDATQRALAALSRTAVPRAARDLVNSLAFEGRGAWQAEMRATLTLRNRFTERRALVERARTLRMSDMRAELGHTEPYMALLEEGGREPAARRHRAIPTESAAGQARSTLRSGRKRAVRAANIIRRLGKVPSGRAARAGGRRAMNARAVREAIASGRRLMVLRDVGAKRRTGVYRVAGKGRRAKLTKLYDLTRSATPVPRTPTLGRAVARALARAGALAERALARELARLGGKTT